MIKRFLRGLSFGLVHRVPVFKLKVQYKSGTVHTFETYSFSIDRGTWSWDSVSQYNKPLLLGIDNIEAVWQVGARHVIKFGRKKGA